MGRYVLVGIINLILGGVAIAGVMFFLVIFLTILLAPFGVYLF